MRRIIQANIDRFTLMLGTETDPAKRAILARLLAEQEDWRQGAQRLCFSIAIVLCVPAPQIL